MLQGRAFFTDNGGRNTKSVVPYSSPDWRLMQTQRLSDSGPVTNSPEPLFKSSFISFSIRTSLLNFRPKNRPLFESLAVLFFKSYRMFLEIGQAESIEL